LPQTQLPETNMNILTRVRAGTLVVIALFGAHSVLADDTPKADTTKDYASRCKALKGDEKRACRKEMARESCDKLTGTARDRCLGVPSADPDPVAPLGQPPRPPG
jgi:hypothetical protein